MPSLPSAEELADALNRIGGYTKRSAPKSGGFMARCPNHNDRTPSLLISERKDGGLQLYCFGGCQTREVYEAVESAMGYEPGTLRKPHRDSGPRLPPKPKSDAKKPRYTAIVPIPDSAPAFDHNNPIFTSRDGAKLTASWPYVTEGGQLVGYVARYETVSDDGHISKNIMPWIYGQDGDQRRWVRQSFPTPRPLYNLQKIAENPDAVIQIHEGEKAADAGQKLIPDWISTTPPGGGQAVHLADLEPLRDRLVVICPDNDQPGTEFAIKLAGLLHGIAREVRILRLPTVRIAPDDSIDLLQPFVPGVGDDVADYIEAGWTNLELRQVLHISETQLLWPIAH